MHSFNSNKSCQTNKIIPYFSLDGVVPWEFNCRILICYAWVPEKLLPLLTVSKKFPWIWADLDIYLCDSLTYTCPHPGNPEGKVMFSWNLWILKMVLYTLKFTEGWQWRTVSHLTVISTWMRCILTQSSPRRITVRSHQLVRVTWSPPETITRHGWIFFKMRQGWVAL